MNDTSIIEELNSTINGTTSTFKATPQGLLLAYTSLVVMALLPIVIGSFKSVKHQSNQKESGEDVETMSTKEALMFPLIASVTLFGIYIVFKLFSKEYINLLLSFYFFVLGIFALTRAVYPLIVRLLPSNGILTFLNEKYDLKIHLNTVNSKETLFKYDNIIDRQLLLSFVLSFTIGVWYFFKKHWIANNIFGLAFSINGIEFLQLNKIKNGLILLCGLFIYDVFWVFGTNVMVTVAKSFEAPIKLTFPQDLLENLWNADKFAILGLGDIVIPGIFIALLLRFDFSLKKTQGIKYLYFYSSFIAYILALLCTIVVMHVFKHAQPALLYIVPLCLIIPLFIGLINGDLKAMFDYKDHEDAITGNDSQSNENDTKKIN